MLRITGSVLGAALIACAFVQAVASGAHAADAQTVTTIGAYQAADRQAFLEAGARKEGQLLVYAVGSQIDPVVKAFGAKYPFLTVKVYKGDIPLLLRKVMEEYRAGVSQRRRLRARRLWARTASQQ